MNWTEQIIARVASWLNLTDNPTPQEVHQSMENVADLDTLRSSIREEITNENAALVQQLSQASTDADAQLATAQTRISQLETELATARARVTELESIEGEHTKQKSTGANDDGGKQTEMPVWDKFKASIGL